MAYEKKEFNKDNFKWSELEIVKHIDLYKSNKYLFGITTMENVEKGTYTDNVKMGKGFETADGKLIMLKQTTQFKMDMLPDVISALQAIYDESMAKQNGDNDEEQY